MFTNSSAVIYHYDEKADMWIRSFFPCAYIFRFTKSSVSSSDFSQNSNVVIRIPDYAKIDISVGDYILTGKSDCPEPDTSACFRVTAFSNNSFGSSPHLKIICS